MKNRKYYIIIIVLLQAACNKSGNNSVNNVQGQTPAVSQVVAIGRVEPEVKITPIGSQVNGIVKHLYVHEGDSVKKGQLLVELVHDYEDAQLNQAFSKLTTQKAEIENAAAQLASAKLKTENLRIKLQRVKNMVGQNAETLQNLDNAQTDYDQSVIDIERDSALLKSEKAKLNEREADLSVIQAQIAQKKITAPANGIVLNMELTEGTAVASAKSLFDFAPAAPLTVLCEVDELLADKVKVGQKAFIRIQGTNQQLAQCEVVYVSPYLKRKSLFSDDSGNMEDRRVREVRLLIKNNVTLLYNTRVEAVIYIR